MLKNEQGFTMIELLLVLLGAVLFASMGLYTLRAQDQAELSMVAKEIQTLIRQTQDMAYQGQDLYEIIFYRTKGTCVQVCNNRVTKTIKVPRSVTIEATNFPRGELSFNGKLTPSGGGTILLYSKSHYVSMTVLPVTGRVKIYSGTRKKGDRYDWTKELYGDFS